MKWEDIAGVILDGLAGTESTVTAILRGVGKLDEAQPYMSIAYIGVRYLRMILENSDNPDVVKAILTRSPSELWNEALDVESEVKIIKNAQLSRIGE